MRDTMHLSDPVVLDAANLEAVFGVRIVVCPALKSGVLCYTLSMAPDVTVHHLTAAQARAVIHLAGRAVSTATIQEAPTR